MFIGIEYTTDDRYRNYKFKKFSSEKSAISWKAAGKLEFAFPGAAREDIPPYQQNFHRKLRAVYQMPYLFRQSKKEISKIRGNGYYMLDYQEALYRYYIKNSVREL